MDVWDPREEMTVFSQIKKAIKGPISGLKTMTRVIIPGILIVFYFFIFFLLLSGCSYFQKEKMDDEIIITDLPPVEMSPEQKIACIKMEPECDLDR